MFGSHGQLGGGGRGEMESVGVGGWGVGWGGSVVYLVLPLSTDDQGVNVAWPHRFSSVPRPTGSSVGRDGQLGRDLSVFFAGGYREQF